MMHITAVNITPSISNWRLLGDSV